MRNKKFGAALATLLLSTMLLTACSVSDNDKTNTSSGEAQTEVTTDLFETTSSKYITKDSSFFVGKDGAMKLADVNEDTIIIDVYFDPLCPGCQAFEQQTSEYVAKLLSDGTAVVRYHPLMFLDDQSTDEYSSRMSAYILGVVENEPTLIEDFIQAIYQADFYPGEGTSYVSKTTDKFDELLLKLGGSKDSVKAINEKMNDNAKAVYNKTLDVMRSNKLRQQSPTGSLYTPFVIPNGPGETDATAMSLTGESMLAELEYRVNQLLEK